MEGSGGAAKFWLAPVSLARSRRYNRRQLSQIEAIVRRLAAQFEVRWHEFFG